MTRKLIGVNRDIMEESIKSLNIGAKVLARRSRAMWDILLASEDAAKSLAGGGGILTTKSVRLQTEDLGTRKTKVTLHEVPLFISLDHLGIFFSKFGEVASVSAVKSKTGIDNEDVEIMVTVTREIFWLCQMY